MIRIYFWQPPRDWKVTVSGLPLPPFGPMVSRISLKITQQSLWMVRLQIASQKTPSEFYTGLIGRLLYRIKSLSEQSPFEAHTFSLIWPLLNQIVNSGGINAASEDDAIEQLVLVLEIIRSHSAQCMSFFQWLVHFFICF